MPRMRSPRQGSMQFWPRKKAASIVARIRTWPASKDVKLLGYAAYKVGMTHVMLTDNRQTSVTKNETIAFPVTILECPPIKIASILLYKKTANGLQCCGQINHDKLDKEVSRRLPPVKKQPKQANTQNIVDVRVLAYTQPKLVTIGKKTPELLEIGIGGNNAEEKLKYAQSILGKEIKATEVFSDGQVVDTVSITKGKGTVGPVQRFGLALRSHKSEKTKRGPGSLGPWHGPRLYRAPHLGQKGFQQRTETNKQILKIDSDVKKVNPEGGFLRYGFVKNDYIIMKGSIGGAHKRLVTLVAPTRPIPKLPKEAPTITHISTVSKQ